MAPARLPYWCDLQNHLHFQLLGIRKVEGRMSCVGISGSQIGRVYFNCGDSVWQNQKCPKNQLSFEVGSQTNEGLNSDYGSKNCLHVTGGVLPLHCGNKELQ